MLDITIAPALCRPETQVKLFDVLILAQGSALPSSTARQLLSDFVLVMYQGNIVEAGLVERVFKSSDHPYTDARQEPIPVGWLLGRIFWHPSPTT